MLNVPDSERKWVGREAGGKSGGSHDVEGQGGGDAEGP